MCIERLFHFIYQINRNFKKIVLLSQSAQISSDDYEKKFFVIRREKEDLLLQCAQLQSELESMKMTAHNAIASFGVGKNEDEDQMTDKPKPKRGGIAPSSDSMGDLTSLLEKMSKNLQIDSADAQLEAPLVLEFLQNLYKQKENEQKNIGSQLLLLSADIKKMEEKVVQFKKAAAERRKSKSPLGKRGRYQPESDEEDDGQELKKRKLTDIRFASDLESTYFTTRAASDNPDSALQTFSQHLSTVRFLLVFFDKV